MTCLHSRNLLGIGGRYDDTPAGTSPSVVLARGGVAPVPHQGPRDGRERTDRRSGVALPLRRKCAFHAATAR